MTRTCCVQCVDWPVVVARLADRSLCGVPVVVRERVGARDVVRAASQEAKHDGVRVGMRRREAEACCGEAVVLDADSGAEARAFEVIARAVEAFTPRVELHEPGRLTFSTRGPSRYFGGDDALATKVLEAVTGTSALAQARVGVADGRFAARLAARAANPVAVVAPDGSAHFLAPYPVTALGDPALAALLQRLGLPTLGDFAALDASAVLARFGRDGAHRQALACGRDPAPAGLGAVPPDTSFAMELDPPAARVDTAAFAAKALADQLVAELDGRGLACTRVLIEAETEHGERLARSWWHDDGFRPAVLAERLRWQLDGWLAANAPHVDDGDVRAQQDLITLADSGLAPAGGGTTGALTLLVLTPEVVVPVPARQLGFFSGDPAAALRADRCLARVQGMVGFDRVGTFVQQGGRTPHERVVFVPWGEPRIPARPLVQQGETVAWPGAWPSPSPTRVFVPGLAAALLDEHGAPVQVSGRGEASAPPRRIRCGALFGDSAAVVVGWAGPWPGDVRWWDDDEHWRGAHWQLLVETIDGQVACWATSNATQATVDAIYD